MHRPPRMSLRLKEMRCENTGQTKRANGVTKTVMSAEINVTLLVREDFGGPNHPRSLDGVTCIVEKDNRTATIGNRVLDDGANVSRSATIRVGHRNQPFLCSCPVWY